MKRLLRGIGIALASLAGLAIIAYAVLYVLSERVLRRTYDVPVVTLSIPNKPIKTVGTSADPLTVKLEPPCDP